jgi:hypothetical protein
MWHGISGYEESISRHIKKQKTEYEVADDTLEPDMALSQSKLLLKL